MDMKRSHYTIHSAKDYLSIMFYIIVILTLAATSTLQDNVEGQSRESLTEALNENIKSETNLIRYLSDDMQIVEPNAIYLQCVVPQVSIK